MSAEKEVPDEGATPLTASTYKDIQRTTGLSLATISKFYNGRNVRAENRIAIEAAAEALDFRPNSFARNLRSRRSRTIGVLLPALDNDFHLSIIAGVESALRKHGMSVIVSSSPDRDVRAVELLLSRMVDGIVAIPSEHDVIALAAAAKHTPVIQVDWKAEGLDTAGVFLDNHRAGAMAARHLLDHGHRRLGVVGGIPSVSSLRDRTRGFIDEVNGSNLQIDPSLVMAGPLTVASGKTSMEALLQARERPTALFSTNYHLTLGALIALNESGLRLGRDISLIGFDGVELAMATSPRLTVIEQPTHEIAKTAAERIRILLTAGPGVHPIELDADTVFAPRLVPGASVIHADDH